MTSRSSLLLFALLAACGGSSSSPSDGSAGDSSIDAPPRPLPRLVSSGAHCKLLSNRNTSDPTPNDVQHRANILGADLGIPVDHANTLYIFFGDTIGYAGIWGVGQSHPDSVGFATMPASAISANPSLLCSNLRALTLAPGDSIGPTVDPTVEADFAANAMAAPSGHTLGEYIRNPSGMPPQTFPHLPGDFEVPSGAFSHDGSIYVFYTTVESPTDITMKASYLARWANPATAGLPSYSILYGVDHRFDATGPLGGNFINVAAVPHDDYLYAFGTGIYRASAVHLARKPLSTLSTDATFEPLGEIIPTAGYGETSVRYYPTIDRWMFLAQQQTPEANRVVARFADRPEGPWSEALVVHDMADSAFRARYCCAVENDCQNDEFMNCNRTGFYATYLFPDVILEPDGFTVTYTISSFDPYNVALFSATFAN